MAGEKGSYQVRFYSNDGSQQLGNTYFGEVGEVAELQVTHDSLIYEDRVLYTYSGERVFKGVATVRNATVATYSVGQTFTYLSDEENVYFYIVEEEKPKPTKTFDLSTLNLSAGKHEITVKARASGYKDSPASNAVSYVVAGNTVKVSGTWYFNKEIDPDIPNSGAVVTFVSNGIACNYMRTLLEENESLIYGNDTTDYSVYFKYDGWTNEAYRTITFDGTQTVSKEFYDWLIANAVRQGNVISFAVAGNTYQAIEGMTWGEWVESEYNIKGLVIDVSGEVRGPSGIAHVTNKQSEVQFWYMPIINGAAYNLGTHTEGGGSN